MNLKLFAVFLFAITPLAMTAELRIGMIGLGRMGHVALCPHANTAHFDTFFPDIPDEAYLTGDLLLLERNPLQDIAHLKEPAGVMARGEWMPSEHLHGMLDALKH